MMKDYNYRVSIIVPVYNVEDYLAECLDSLLNQTMPREDMEIIVVNDGSTDSSYEIAKEYAEKYPCIKLFSKENEGLSATRNYGINRATGKYMMFIDSDDSFTEPTVKSVADFFDTVYDEVDLVTYFEQPYTTERDLAPHFRYKHYLKETGVYDLNEQPFIVQTRVNVCVKNLFENNFMFDTTPGFKQEDQEYNNRVVKEKMKIGYCAEGCYRYNKSNESSIVATTFHAFYLFELSMAYFERLFGQFEDEVPPYFQAMFVHDVRWKLSSKILYPFHYEGEKFEQAVGRIKALLARVDVQTILRDPISNNFQKQYWISMKPNVKPTVYTDGKSTGILVDGRFIYHCPDIEVKIVRIQPADNNKLLVRAYVRSPLYNHIDEATEIYICENGDMNNLVVPKTYLSKYGYESANVRTNNFYAVEYLCDPDKITSFQHFIKLDGYYIPARYTFMSTSVFSHAKKLYSYVCGNAKITLNNKVFEVEKLTDQEVDDFETKQTKRLKFLDRDAKKLRLSAIKYRRQHRIWLYSDLYTVKKDNGYYQFINDFSHDDGVERYYVYTRDYDEIAELFTPEQRKNLVEFGSERHKLLYLSSELILSGFYGRSPISPFELESEEQNYYDIEHFKVVYLQHGVLHASLYVQNSAENARAEKVVISSPFEKKNYCERYNYNPEDLIESSMSRYDHIDFDTVPGNKILFAPSWRNYLASNVTASKWSVMHGKIVASDYYKNIQAFIESPKLHEILEKYDMTLELKLHPIISSATDLFNITSDRIVYAASDVDVADYKVFMTDFSSFVFDYACLVRPILYFVPDYPQFKSGMGHYRDLDLPFEDAFGPLSLNAEDTVANLEKVLAADCVPAEPYKERMENFYYPLENCAERLYEYITTSDFLKK
ncbi:MAG: glycosyltransferase [Clostridia bacterium]|nr:glycosyltransferase [Clostridia bacterium]